MSRMNNIFYKHKHTGRDSEKIDYNNLDNKPVFEIQVNADWDETDPASLKYIENKPSIVNADWDETDTSAMGYINNKPELIGFTKILEATGSSIQSIPEYSHTNILFQTEVLDYGNQFISPTWTCKIPGTYRFKITGTLTGRADSGHTSSSMFQIRVKRNGAYCNPTDVYITSTSNADYPFEHNDILFMEVGDYVTIDILTVWVSGTESLNTARKLEIYALS